MRPQILYFFFALAAVASSTSASLAQSAAAPGTQRIHMRPGVRYTTGTYIVNGEGWEKQLCDGNPNLKKWSWIPIIGYSQSTGTTSKQAVQVPATARPEHRSVYIKPNHVPLPVVTHTAAKLMTKAHLQNPVSADGASSNRVETQTQAVLHMQNQPVLSYAGDYHGYDGFRAASSVHGVLAHKNAGATFSKSIQY